MNKKKIEKLLSEAMVFGGEAGDFVLGLQSIKFPSMLLAARYVEYTQTQERAWIEDTEDGRRPGKFNEPVTIQLDTRR